jgi:hypothetical protein
MNFQWSAYKPSEQRNHYYPRRMTKHHPDHWLAEKVEWHLNHIIAHKPIPKEAS